MEILKSQKLNLFDFYNVLLNIPINTKLFDFAVISLKDFLKISNANIRPIDSVIVLAFENAETLKNKANITEDFFYELLEKVVSEIIKLDLKFTLGNNRSFLPKATETIIDAAVKRFNLEKTFEILNSSKFKELIERCKRIPGFSNIGNPNNYIKTEVSYNILSSKPSSEISLNEESIEIELENILVFKNQIKDLPELITKIVNYLNYIDCNISDNRIKVCLDELIYIKKQEHNQINLESFGTLLNNNEQLKINSIIFIYIISKRVDIQFRINKNLLDENKNNIPSFLNNFGQNNVYFFDNHAIKREITTSLIREFLAYPDLVQIIEPKYINKLMEDLSNGKNQF